MSRIQLAAALTLFSLPLVAGCAHRGAVDPIGRSTTTGGVVCPQGYVTSDDGRTCVTPPPSADDDYQFQVP